MNKSRAALVAVLLCLDVPRAWAAGGQYENFKVAVYIPVQITRSLADPQRLQSDWDRLNAQIKIDKVYLETYRDHQWADDATVEPIKKFFMDKGVTGFRRDYAGGGGDGGPVRDV